MSLVQLESFVAVAEEGTVLKAAARLHLSQPPLSRRIQALESELGVALFERSARGMQLSPSGEALLEPARAILAAVQAAAELVRVDSEEATATRSRHDHPRRAKRLPSHGAGST